MKHWMSVVVTTLLCVSIAYAQMTPKGVRLVSEKNSAMSLGDQNALVVQLPGMDGKIIGKAWESFIKNNYGGKAEMQRKTKEWFTDDISIPAIGGATPVDLHAQISTSKRGDSEMFLWVNMGTRFLSSREYPEQYAEAEKMLVQFATEVKREAARNELAEQEKELKRLEKELEKLQAAHDRHLKEIEKAKEAIKKAEDNIAQNGKEQEQMRQKISEQKNTLNNAQRKLQEIN
jgi:hypothetical protein